MEEELFILEDGDVSFNVIDWGDKNSLNFNIYEAFGESEDNISSMGFILDVKDVKDLIRVLQRWVEK